MQLVWVRGPSFWCPSIRGVARMEPLVGPPVSSPDPAIISSVEQQASSSTHAVSDMLASSPSVMTHTTQYYSNLRSTFDLIGAGPLLSPRATTRATPMAHTRLSAHTTDDTAGTR